MKYIILISGKLQSGKNQFAEYMQEYLEYNGKKVSTDLFAKGVKDGCREDFADFAKCLNEKIYAIKQDVYALGQHSDKSHKILESLNELEIHEDNWYEDKTDLTRVLLQIYGTEIFRARVRDTYWPDQLSERCSNSDSEFILVTDTRFVNEVEVIKEYGECSTNIEVVSIRINRDIQREESFNEHSSETALDDYKDWDFVVANDGDLKMLSACAHQITDEIAFYVDQTN